ncbi:NAD(+) synthase [Flavobacteriales bacterium]|jgi:NAD+ synthase|nr:NAD(+) synthase [Flavobacteriales bacterium]MDC3305313.1 NAD(+) synthase [Flavobacteriales bacterium]MDG1348145.1 NAD(+) synthase [Flavobacteriales bacterium]|tara:strand:- start:15876 stop:16649 length:774 start_codon:yes stop_codon:yes gene_type:complete
MQTTAIINHISDWLLTYAQNTHVKGYVIGISGGIDSAVTSTLAAKTGLPLLCVEMPIHQDKTQVERGLKHIAWLKANFENVSTVELELSSIFDGFINQLPLKEEKHELALVNTRARLRMTTLYYFAQANNSLVLGTGNKVEDFGIGFFTKYGDGGVDISPIADLLKTEVYALGEELGIDTDILSAPPTDGLWGDDKTDEDQIGASYPELEWAMAFDGDKNTLTAREKQVFDIYTKMNKANLHKMQPIPVCKIPNTLK